MIIDASTRKKLRIQNILFVLLFVIVIVLGAIVTRLYNIDLDLSATGRNSLKPVSNETIRKFKGPVVIKSFIPKENTDIRDMVEELIPLYKSVNDNVQLEILDSYISRSEYADLGIRYAGELVIQYQGRTEHALHPTEEEVTNALLRLLRNKKRMITFISGHGERDPAGTDNFGYAGFFDDMENTGIVIKTVNLANTLKIPDATTILVIASPQSDYLPGEIEIIQKYLDNGGNLLWLVDPFTEAPLKELQKSLSIYIPKGAIVDTAFQALTQHSNNDPTYIQGQFYPHEISKAIEIAPLFFRCAAIGYEKNTHWKVQPILQSLPRSWLEKDLTAKFDEGIDIKGPIQFGLVMTREIKNKSKHPVKQRVVIIGDSDFMSNQLITQKQNYVFAEKTINWLARDDNFVDIPPNIAPDRYLELKRSDMTVILVIFVIIIPAALLIAGVTIWIKRRKS